MRAKDNGSSSGETKSDCWKINGPKQDSKIVGGSAKLLSYVTLQQKEACFRKGRKPRPRPGKTM